ncbi:MAG: hypothetical protein HS128_16555 [Ideonella sp.]|nr:hypothetical protein [Ideonella sp.]MCC7456906.1 hypothetical protein [Nitrospira sp.]
MRTTFDLPESVLHQLKARAALEGSTLNRLAVELIERGLAQPASPHRKPAGDQLPPISLGRRMGVKNPSNAALFELIDE